jgi:arylsulfatase A-like enzyme
MVTPGGRKRDLTEGGIREPGLLEWPRMIKTNLVTDFPAATFDYKPTVLEILGIEAPTGWPLDGTSLVPLIKGEVPTFSALRPTSLNSYTWSCINPLTIGLGFTITIPVHSAHGLTG